MTNKHSTAHQAIQDAWDFWLSQHPISVPEMVESAIAKAVHEWLCSETERLIDAVAEKVAERLPDSVVEFLESELESLRQEIGTIRAQPRNMGNLIASGRRLLLRGYPMTTSPTTPG